jgi:hypothetical protein
MRRNYGRNDQLSRRRLDLWQYSKQYSFAMSVGREARKRFEQYVENEGWPRNELAELEEIVERLEECASRASYSRDRVAGLYWTDGKVAPDPRSGTSDSEEESALRARLTAVWGSDTSRTLFYELVERARQLVARVHSATLSDVTGPIDYWPWRPGSELSH